MENQMTEEPKCLEAAVTLIWLALSFEFLLTLAICLLLRSDLSEVLPFLLFQFARVGWYYWLAHAIGKRKSWARKTYIVATLIWEGFFLLLLSLFFWKAFSSNGLGGIVDLLVLVPFLCYLVASIILLRQDVTQCFVVSRSGIVCASVWWVAAIVWFGAFAVIPICEDGGLGRNATILATLLGISPVNKGNHGLDGVVPGDNAKENGSHK